MSDETRPAAGKGVIHDLGYARYAGERSSTGTLWRVIMRHQLSYAWKTRWRFKPWLGLAVIVTAIVGGLMYLEQNSMIQALRQMGKSIRLIDAALPMSYEYYRMAAFMVSMTIGAAVVARDQESGAFTFYFSRPVRAFDYVAGKLAGMTLLMACLFLAGPVALAFFRLGVAAQNDGVDEMVRQLVVLPKVLLIGGLGTLVFAALPLAISSLAGRRTLALGLWAAYYIVGTALVANLGALLWRPLRALDPGIAMSALASGLFHLDIGTDLLPPVWAAVGSLVLQTTAAVVVLYLQIKKQAEGAVGGSS